MKYTPLLRLFFKEKSEYLKILLNMVVISLIFHNCGKNNSNQFIDNHNSLIKNTEKFYCIPKDTITPLGIKITYKRVYKGIYEINWSNDNFKRSYFDSGFCCNVDSFTGNWDFVPRFYSESKNFLVLTATYSFSSGSNPAPLDFYALILPKNLDDSIYKKTFFIESSGAYLAYWNTDSKDDSLSIINLETKLKQSYYLEPKPFYSRSPTMAFHENFFKNKKFFIKYETLDNNNELKLIKRHFKLAY